MPVLTVQLFTVFAPSPFQVQAGPQHLPDAWDNVEVNTQVRVEMDCEGQKKGKKSPQCVPCSLGTEQDVGEC